jgi:hypothetical protein
MKHEIGECGAVMIETQAGGVCTECGKLVHLNKPELQEDWITRFENKFGRFVKNPNFNEECTENAMILSNRCLEEVEFITSEIKYAVDLMRRELLREIGDKVEEMKRGKCVDDSKNWAIHYRGVDEGLEEVKSLLTKLSKE